VQIPFRPDYRFALGLTPAIRADLARFAPDLIHVSAPDLLGQGAQAYARERGLPVVASLHTFFERYLEYYGLGWLRPGVEKRLNAFYDACDYVLAPNAAIANQLAEGGLGERAKVWSRGVDRELFSPARRDLDWRRAQGFADHETVCVFFGRVVLEKGLGVFADAIDKLSEARLGARALVIGDGPARPWLQKRLPDAVFTGMLSGPDLGRAVASSDILINPSTTETFCNVTLEAMASGLALVCADAANNRMLVEPGRSGLLVPPKDAEAYAAEAKGLIASPVRRLGLATAARTASASYGWPAILDGVAEVYAEALAARTRTLKGAPLAA
jgi:glycosyltransferase involved in cell wall biosynthesis